jgi:hypothetical protein
MSEREMALSPIDAVCTKCSAKFNQAPKQTFLGFQRLTCPTCQEKVSYPLTRTYRIIFWVILVAEVVGVASGGIGYIGIVLIIATAYGLWRDAQIRSRLAIGT